MKLPALVSHRAVGFSLADVQRRAADAVRVAARRRGKRESMGRWARRESIRPWQVEPGFANQRAQRAEGLSFEASAADSGAEYIRLAGSQGKVACLPAVRPCV